MEDNNHDTITRLKFLSRIRKGKINVQNNMLQPDTWITSFSRSLLNADNRQNTLTYVQNSISSGFQLFGLYIKSEKLSEKKLAEQIIKDIANAKNGINNLKHTYTDDTMFCCSIETYLQTIDAKLTEYQEKYPGIFQVIESEEHTKSD